MLRLKHRDRETGIWAFRIKRLKGNNYINMIRSACPDETDGYPTTDLVLFEGSACWRKLHPFYVIYQRILWDLKWAALGRLAEISCLSGWILVLIHVFQPLTCKLFMVPVCSEKKGQINGHLIRVLRYSGSQRSDVIQFTPHNDLFLECNQRPTWQAAAASYFTKMKWALDVWSSQTQTGRTEVKGKDSADRCSNRANSTADRFPSRW